MPNLYFHNFGTLPLGGDSQTPGNKTYSVARRVSECATPNTVGTASFFWEEAPSMEQPELVLKFLTVMAAL